MKQYLSWFNQHSFLHYPFNKNPKNFLIEYQANGTPSFNNVNDCLFIIFVKWQGGEN